MEKRFRSVREVGEWLGISRTAAYELVRDGSLPSVRIAGAGIRVPTSVLEEFATAMEEKASTDSAA
jgi:excisionase family DNA binding protein